MRGAGRRRGRCAGVDELHMWGGHQPGAGADTALKYRRHSVSCLAERLHIIDRMSPGGHAATTVVASAVTLYVSGSLSLTTAVHGFDGTALMGHRDYIVPVKFWSAFFKGASPND